MSEMNTFSILTITSWSTTYFFSQFDLNERKRFTGVNMEVCRRNILVLFCLFLSFTQDIMGKRASISYQVLNLNIMWNKANYITFCNNFSIYDKTLASWRPITFGTEKIFVFTILVTWDKIIFRHRFSIPKEFFFKNTENRNNIL